MKVVQRMAHNDKVNSVAWHPDQSKVLISVGDDKRALLWDTVSGTEESECSQSSGGRRDPTSQYEAPEAICNLAWSREKSSWAAISFNDSIQAVKV